METTLTTHRIKMVPTIVERDAIVSLPDNTTAEQIAAIQTLFNELGADMSDVTQLNLDLSAALDTVISDNQTAVAGFKATIADLQTKAVTPQEIADLKANILKAKQADMSDTTPAPVDPTNPPLPAP